MVISVVLPTRVTVITHPAAAMPSTGSQPDSGTRSEPAPAEIVAPPDSLAYSFAISIFDT